MSEDFYAHSGIGTAIRADAATDELKGYPSLLVERFGEISLYKYNGLSSIKTEVTDELPTIYNEISQDMEELSEYTKVAEKYRNCVNGSFQCMRLLPLSVGVGVDSSLPNFSRHTERSRPQL